MAVAGPPSHTPDPLSAPTTTRQARSRSATKPSSDTTDVYHSDDDENLLPTPPARGKKRRRASPAPAEPPNVEKFPDFTVAKPSTLPAGGSPGGPRSPSPDVVLLPPPVLLAPPPAEPEPLSAYSCPVCFCPPSYATMTPCGHVLCGECLFTAIKTTLRRVEFGHVASVARCPVCRAVIPSWDGRGGGVIGLKPRTVTAL